MGVERMQESATTTRSDGRTTAASAPAEAVFSLPDHRPHAAPDADQLARDYWSIGALIGVAVVSALAAWSAA
jgi:hypothetical protein